MLSILSCLFQDRIQVSIDLNTATYIQENNIRTNKDETSLPIYTSESSGINGRLNIMLNGTKGYSHQGIYIELICGIQDKNPYLFYPFHEDVVQLEPKGTLNEDTVYNFQFKDFPMAIETYQGLFGSIKYFIRAVVARRFRSNIVVDQDIIVQSCIPKNPFSRFLHKELTDDAGAVRLSYEQNKQVYFLDDCIVGSLKVMAEGLKPRELSISLNKWEYYRLLPDAGPNENFEMLDYFDLKKHLKNDETDNIIPFRIPLSRYALQPTLRAVNEEICFYVGYFIRVVVVEANGKKWCRSMSFALQRRQE